MLFASHDFVCADDLLIFQEGTTPTTLLSPRQRRLGWVSAADFIRSFANWRLQAARKPVVVTHHGKDAHVLISLDDYRRLALVPEANRALRAAAAYEGDVLIVESENDTIVPHEVVVNYRNACKKARSLTCRSIAGADHGLTDPAWRDAYTKLLVDWISKMVAQEVTDDATAQKRLREAMKTQTAIRTA